MFDILPFPNITAKDNEERISQVIEYLFQFKEDLEFLLTNLTTENLSPELQAKISSVKPSEDVFTAEQTEQITQMKGPGGGASVSDVMNSEAFQAYAKRVTEYTDRSEEDANEYTDQEIEKLNYIVSVEQTQSSILSGGENVFTFTNKDGSKTNLTVRNGTDGLDGDGSIIIAINYETGELEYTSKETQT